MALTKTDSFLKQIKEDIADYQNRYSDSLPNIEKEEWAFNYWILDKFYSVEEEVIFNQITDYNDKGVDAWVFHEDTNDLYIIQNKFYGDNTPLSKDYVMNDFLVRSIGSLENETYTRSPELQKQFSKHKNERNFTVYFMLYVTNNNISSEIYDAVKGWNESKKDKNYIAKIFSLNDIYEAYFDDLLVERKNLTVSISTLNKGTVLHVNNESYGMNLAIDAKYVLTPIIDIYQIVKEARNKGYQIFENNIREYLGSSVKVNKGILETLKDPSDRNNFFFYNNGITIICDNITIKDANKTVVISNPQIVNGCQTVSTIYEHLDSFTQAVIQKDYVNCYVMAKILKINTNASDMQVLYDNIVKYNNSQNAIQPKMFSAKKSEFYRMQKEFMDRGFYLCVKQSDDYTFNKTGNLIESKQKTKDRFVRFGINSPKNIKPFIINLEKFLQVIIAFAKSSQDAVQNKSKLLKDDSLQNDIVISFIKNPDNTINNLLDLYCLYLRNEQDKGKEKNPNSFMLIDSIANFECNRDLSTLCNTLQNPDKINKLLALYKATLNAYYDTYKTTSPGKEYNDMIKEQISFTTMAPLISAFKASGLFS